MTSDTKDFLKFLINEEIYLIDSQEADGQPKPIVADKPSASLEDSTVVAEEEAAPVAPSAPVHEILVIFDNPISKDLVAGDREYLGKILGAIGQSIDQVAFHNMATGSTSTEGYRFVMAFTPNHQLEVPISTMQYTSVKLKESQLIVADALSNIAQSTDLRKKLWAVLQQVFK